MRAKPNAIAMTLPQLQRGEVTLTVRLTAAERAIVERLLLSHPNDWVIGADLVQAVAAVVCPGVDVTAEDELARYRRRQTLGVQIHNLRSRGVPIDSSWQGYRIPRQHRGRAPLAEPVVMNRQSGGQTAEALAK